MTAKANEPQLKPVNYKSEKDFVNEFEALLETIRDTSFIETDWKKRMEALDLIKRIVIGNASAKFVESFDSFMLKCVVPVSSQILDLRSAIAKEACITIETMAKSLKNDFEQAAERYVSANCLLKLILSGNKLMAESGHKAILTILQNVTSAKLLLRIADEMKGKNSLLRGKCSFYLQCILTNYPSGILEKYTASIEDMIKTAVNDASADTRATGRECYTLYAHMFPGKATALYGTFPGAVQKAITDAKSHKGKDTPMKNPTQKLPHAGKGNHLGPVIPKTMYNSWKENTETGNNPQRSVSSKRKKQSLNEPKMIPAVTLQQVKPPEDPEAGEADFGESGCVGPSAHSSLGLDQSGFEEQKGEEMASCIDDLDAITDTNSSPIPLPELLAQAKLENIEKKRAAIEEIGKLFQSDERIIYSNEFKAGIEVLIESVTSNHYKIAQCALQGIGNAIVVYTKQMLAYADQLAPKILFTMSDKREPVTNASNFVFQLMHTNYGPDKLMPAFIKCLEPYHIMRIKAGALEVMNMLIKESANFFTIEQNVKLCTQKAAQLINDNYKNKKITLPALGVLLALRDKDYNSTISTILTMPETQQTKVKALAHEYARDLQDNIEAFRLIPHELDTKPMGSAGKLSLTAKRKEGSAERKKVVPKAGASKPGSAVKAPAKKQAIVRPIATENEEVKEAWKEESEEKGPVKINTKAFPKKSSSPPPRAMPKLSSEAQLLTNSLAHGKTYSIEEVSKLLDAISKVVANKSQKPFCEKIMPKVTEFVFDNAIFTSEETLQKAAFDALKSLLQHQSEILSLHFEKLLENIAKCYMLPKKTWETISTICRLMAVKFTPRRVMLELSEKISAKDPPVLQAFIRCTNNILQSFNSSDIPAANLAKPLFLEMNHENADVRKEAVFCIVEMYRIMGKEFEKYLTQLTASQIKLIKIYLSKRGQKVEA